MKNIVVTCGMPRSGTSFAGALLNVSPEIEMFNEIPFPEPFFALSSLVEQYRAIVTGISLNVHEHWRGFTVDVMEERIPDFSLAYLRALKPVVDADCSRWDAGQKPSATIACIKRPNAELHWQVFNSLFGKLMPYYIYCLREPLSVYRSLLSVPWGQGLMPEPFLDLLKNSLEAVLALRRSHEDHLLVFDLSESEYFSKSDREKLARSVYAYVGAEYDVDVSKFVSQWPGINRTRDKAMSTGLELNEVDRRIDRLQTLLAAPGVRVGDLLSELKRRP